MKAKYILPMAFGLFLIPKLATQAYETHAFMMGGGGATACKVMIPVDHEANYDVTLKTEYGTETVPFLAMFNPNCAKVQEMDYAVEHINNGKNLFFLNEYGGMVGYMPVSPGYEKLQLSSTLDVLPIIDSTVHGGKFVGYSVPRNDTSCGATHGKYKPICDDSNHYGWGHALKSYTTSNLKALASAIKAKNQSKINSLTGEYEFIGYSTDGTPLNNTYFPSEYPVQYVAGNDKAIFDGSKGSGKPNVYPFIDDPWSKGTAETLYDDGRDAERTNIKRNAISRLIKQENLSGSVDKWMNKLSLKNNATAQAGVFEGREKHGLYNIVVLEAPSTSRLNVAIMEMTLYDEGEKIASFTRDAIGLEFGTTWVKAENNKAVMLEGGKDYTLEIKVVNGSDQSVSTSHLINASIEADDKTLDESERKIEEQIKGGSSSIAKDGEKVFKTTITMPEGNGIITIDAALDEDTYSPVNFNRVDDFAQIVVQVESKGDLSVCAIKVFDKETGKEITVEDGFAGDLVQDREYDVEYHICYDGTQIKGPHKIQVEGYLTTEGSRHEEVSLDRELEIDLSKTTIIKETIRVSNPHIITEIKISTDNEKINKDTTNDSGALDISNSPNVKLTDLTITPNRTDLEPVGCHIVTVSYNLTLDAPKEGYNATFDTQTRIKIGSKEYMVSDKIKKGTDKHTHNLEYCFPEGGPTTGETVEAFVNINQAMHESTYDDNKKEIQWNGIRGDEDRVGCPVGDNVANKVTWNQTYTIYTYEVWEEDGVILEKLIDTEPITKQNETESFKIKSIQMRSKLQQDLQLGDNGWIEVIGVTDGEATQVAVPKIKAGYGFEIRVLAEYETNAFDSMGQLDLEALNNGEVQTIKVIAAGEHEAPNIVNDFFINVDGKLSLKVDEGLSLEVTDSENGEHTKVFDVTITPHNSPNTDEEDDTRIYINENTKDGTYKMTFATPSIVGLTSRSENEQTILCDDIEIEFEVVGSVYDDLNTHQTN